MQQKIDNIKKTMRSSPSVPIEITSNSFKEKFFFVEFIENDRYIQFSIKENMSLFFSDKDYLTNYSLTVLIGYDLRYEKYFISLEIKNLFDNSFLNYQYGYHNINGHPQNSFILIGVYGKSGNITLIRWDTDIAKKFFETPLLIEKIFQNYFSLSKIEDILEIQFDYSLSDDLINIIKTIQTISSKKY